MPPQGVSDQQALGWEISGNEEHRRLQINIITTNNSLVSLAGRSLSKETIDRTGFTLLNSSADK